MHTLLSMAACMAFALFMSFAGMPWWLAIPGIFAVAYLTSGLHRYGW